MTNNTSFSARYLSNVILCLLLLTTVLFTGCSDDDEKSDNVARTVIVYLGVDNNFRGEEKEKIASLLSTWKDYEGHLIVYVDNGTETYTVEICMDATRQAVIREIKQYPAQNSASPEIMRNVLNDIIDVYPADSYGLVVLSHATGWLPTGTMVSPRSIINDRGKEMELREFAEALPVNFDFIIFDACFMGSVEVAYELKNKARYVVASAAEVLVPGFMYHTMMEHLMKKEPDLVAVATDFYNYYNKQSGYYRSATVSVIETAKMEPLAQLSSELLKGVDGETRVDLRQIQTFGYGRHAFYTDFGDYIKAINPVRHDEFMRALNQCLVYTKATPGYYSMATDYNEIKAYSGLTVYVPQAAYPYMNTQYHLLKWSKRVYD